MEEENTPNMFVRPQEDTNVESWWETLSVKLHRAALTGDVGTDPVAVTVIAGVNPDADL